jgi:hypothetical protein
MMLDNLDKAEAHTITAIRRLEMILWLIRQKRVSPEKHVPAYFDLITNDLAAIQDAIFTEEEYTEYVAKGIARLSKRHSYEYQVTSDDNGNVYYNVDALLSREEMKRSVLFARRLP